jgi:hypothetical protein
MSDPTNPRLSELDSAARRAVMLLRLDRLCWLANP